MKKWMYTICGLLLSVAVCQAQLKLGVHGAYSNSGDVENEDFGFGGQLTAVMSESFSIELAGTQFEDKEGDSGPEITTIALTARVGGLVGETATAYIGGGANYNIIDVDVGSGALFDMDVDDSIGFHAAAGLEFMLNENLELFAEYRYTILEVEGSTEMSGLTEDFEKDYNFGLARAGINLIF